MQKAKHIENCSFINQPIRVISFSSLKLDCLRLYNLPKSLANLFFFIGF